MSGTEARVAATRRASEAYSKYAAGSDEADDRSGRQMGEQLQINSILPPLLALAGGALYGLGLPPLSPRRSLRPPPSAWPSSSTPGPRRAGTLPQRSGPLALALFSRGLSHRLLLAGLYLERIRPYPLSPQPPPGGRPLPGPHAPALGLSFPEKTLVLLSGRSPFPPSLPPSPCPWGPSPSPSWSSSSPNSSRPISATVGSLWPLSWGWPRCSGSPSLALSMPMGPKSWPDFSPPEESMRPSRRLSSSSWRPMGFTDSPTRGEGGGERGESFHENRPGQYRQPLKVAAKRGPGETRDFIIDRYRRLSLRPSSRPLDLIVWPETAVPDPLSSHSIASGLEARPLLSTISFAKPGPKCSSGFTIRWRPPPSFPTLRANTTPSFTSGAGAIERVLPQTPPPSLWGNHALWAPQSLPI